MQQCTASIELLISSHVSYASLQKLSESKPSADKFEYGILLVYDHSLRNLGVEWMMSTSCHLALDFQDMGWWPHSNVCCDWLESRCNLWKANPHRDSIFAESWNCILFLALNEFGVEKVVDDVKSWIKMLSLQVPKITWFIVFWHLNKEE